MKKWVNNMISGVLGAFIVFLLGCQVSMIVSERDNYGVPSLFGYSFMTVLTDSMVNTAEPEKSMPVGCGIIMEKTGASDVRVGDVITFYSKDLSAAYGINGIVSHRVMEIEKNTADGTYIFYTRGDNLHAMTCPSGGCSDDYRDVVPEKYYIGKVTYHSMNLGSALSVVQSSWFIPVTVLIPLTAIAVLSAVDLVKQAKKEKQEEETKIQDALAKAGINPNDEKAVLLFTEKERYRLEIKQELEKTKAEEKKRLVKEMKKRENGTIGKKEDDK